ncbi:MAG: hypothetical protein EBZ24_14955 [Synechococcaceae bacterium WB9_4xB_025]|nr:hypothetical protein [Synechococcaceae bacterium WB9_4xB_025]
MAFRRPPRSNVRSDDMGMGPGDDLAGFFMADGLLMQNQMPRLKLLRFEKAEGVQPFMTASGNMALGVTPRTSESSIGPKGPGHTGKLVMPTAPPWMLSSC